MQVLMFVARQENRRQIRLNQQTQNRKSKSDEILNEILKLKIKIEIQTES